MRVNPLRKQTVLVTGGTGFLGSHLIRGLLEQEFSVVNLKRSTSDTWRIDAVADKIKQYDIDYDSTEKIFQEQNIDVVIHTACCYGRKGEKNSELLETNLLFGLRLFEYAEQNHVGAFINTDTFFNTQPALHNYLYHYTLSKRQFAEWIKFLSDKMQVINMKLQHMYGTNDDKSKFIPWIVEQLKQNKKEIQLTAGLHKRDFVFVSDVVSALLTVVKHRDEVPAFSEFDVGTGETITVRDFVEELAKHYKKLHQETVTELLFGSKPYPEDELVDVSVDTGPLKRLGWSPEVSFAEGAKMMIQ